MSTAELAPLVVAVLFVLVVVGTGVLVARRRSRSQDPGAALAAELGAPVDQPRVRQDVERPPAEREEPRREIELRPLPAAARQRYLAAWEGVQRRFVDSPVLALSEADALLTSLLADRGLPSDLRTPAGTAGRHAHAVEAFRAGHAIEQRNSSQRADAAEVLRGMGHFHDVFAALVAEGNTEAAQRPAPEKVSQRENG